MKAQPTEQPDPVDELKAMLRERARRSMLDFTVYTRPFYEPNWHHRVLCEKLDRFVRGEIKRLMVFMPPQNGKSELVSRCLPAFILGKRPTTKIIACSYADALASQMNRDVQRIIDCKQYGELFPTVGLSGKNVRSVAQGSWLRNNDIFEIVGHGGRYRSAGVDGGITGMGAEIFIIDDPIKNQKEAMSPTIRNKCAAWYRNDVFTRLRGADSGVLITQTRWHEGDLSGYLLDLSEEMEDADDWEVLSIPALNEDGPSEDDPRQIGEPLWPKFYPVSYLKTVKAQSEQTWNALYQQRPSSPEGNMIRRDWISYYDDLPDGATDWLQSWDLTFKKTKSGSFVVGQVWCKKDGALYLVDQRRERLDFPGTLQAIKAMKEKYPQTKRILVEDAANGPGIIATLKDKISGIIPVSTKGESKESRLNAVSHFFEAGNVKIPRLPPWVASFVEELVTFPNARTDDQVDAASQALARFNVTKSVRVSMNLGLGMKPAEPWRM